MKLKKILCYLDDDHGRDVEILIPIVYVAEKYLDCKVEFVFVWDIFAIFRKKPDIVLLPNTVGSKWYFEVSKYAYEQGVKVFALVSEGNFRTDGTFNYWGYNYDKKYYQEFLCLWSKRTIDFFRKELPEYQNKIVLTGATGFDRYKICRFVSKQAFLEKYNLSTYKKVIGYAGWSFGKLFTESGRKEIKSNSGDTAEQRMKWMKKQMFLVENILRKVVENNPDILFIFKRHPNEAHPHIVKEVMNEMIRLRDYNNVLYIKDEENIHDLINISDIWMGFESTTAIEAWLLNEPQTLLINPDPDFSRDKLYQGSVIVSDYPELQAAINEFYKTDEIPGFFDEERTKQRNTIITNTIGFRDGMNHIRAGYYLKKIVDSYTERQRHFFVSFRYFKRYLAMKVGKILYIKKLFMLLPKLKKTVWIFERNRLKGLPELKRKSFYYFDIFHKQHGFNEKLKSNEGWEEIFRQITKQ